MNSRKNTEFYSGVLENAGLGEVSYFVKKAKDNVRYAAMALDHTDFSMAKKRVAESVLLIAQLSDKLVELEDKISGIEQESIAAVLEQEFFGYEEQPENVQESGSTSSG